MRFKLKSWPAAIAALIASGGIAWAVNTALSSLSASGAIADANLFYVVQTPGAGGVKATAAQVKTYANTSAVRATTTTSEALANSDQNKLVTFSNAGAVAATIAQAGGGGNFAAGWAVSLKNLGVGTVTLTPATSTVDGAATVVLLSGQGLDLYSDGTNYFTQPGKGVQTSAANTWTAVQTFNANNLVLAGVTGSTQCLNASTTGVVTGTGTACGSGGGAVGLTPYISGSYYIPWGVGSTSTSTTTGANTIRCFMAYFKGQATVDTLTVRVGTTAASGNTQVAIYAVSLTTGLPTGSALATTGNLSTTTAANVTGSVNSGTPVQLGSSSAALTPYAFCTNNDTTAGSTASFTAISSSVMNIAQDFGHTAVNTLFPAIGTAYSSFSYTSQTFNTWPSLTGVTPNSFNSFGAVLPAIHLSSVP